MIVVIPAAHYIPYKRTNLQMFVPQSGKTLFNQSTLLWIIPVSFAEWCQCFETQETENKQGAPGKENTLHLHRFVSASALGPRLACSNRPLTPTDQTTKQHPGQIHATRYLMCMTMRTLLITTNAKEKHVLCIVFYIQYVLYSSYFTCKNFYYIYSVTVTNLNPVQL